MMQEYPPESILSGPYSITWDEGAIRDYLALLTPERMHLTVVSKVGREEGKEGGREGERGGKEGRMRRNAGKRGGRRGGRKGRRKHSVINGLRQLHLYGMHAFKFNNDLFIHAASYSTSSSSSSSSCPGSLD